MSITCGELPEGADARALAAIASAILHSLAIRARCGATRRELRHLAERALRHTLPPPRQRRNGD
jgi:hypothetical protein